MRAKFFWSIVLFVFTLPVAAQKLCFSREARKAAETHALVWHEPYPGYDPVLGYDPSKGPRTGAPPVNDDGLALPVKCTAMEHDKGTGTTPKLAGVATDARGAGPLSHRPAAAARRTYRRAG